MWHYVSFGAGVSSRTRRARRKKGRMAATAAILAVSLAGTSLTAAPAASASPGETVIVTATGLLSPVTAVLEVGGTILSKFRLINGVEAQIPTLLAPVLGALPGITVTPDLSVSVQSSPAESTGPHTPSDAFLQETGADQLAAQGDTGQGVTVAVVDTGIDNLADFSGRLAGGVDLTGGNNPFQDSYGHGTFVAGLIAGNGASSNGQYSGEAPDARLVSVKVAGSTGVDRPGHADHRPAVDGRPCGPVRHPDPQPVPRLPVQPVHGHQPAGPGRRRRCGTRGSRWWPRRATPGRSTAPSCPQATTRWSSPAGALDDMATPSTADDEMADFSSVGPTSPDGWAKPDLVASGRSVVSLAAPGLDDRQPVPLGPGRPANFVGSGTSFSAAITSGAAALVLADHPGLTPNEVKARLLGATTPGPVGNPFVDGHGALDAYAAATAGPMEYNQSATGLLGSLLGATVSLSPSGSADTWNASLWAGLSLSPAPSGGPTWNGWAWSGADWNGWTWTGKAWNDGGWTGASWNAEDWTGKAWNDAGWAGSAWNGAAWNGSAWNSSAWK